MAGGTGRPGPSLAQRRRPADPRSSRADEVCPARHCWVADAADEHGVKRPGLLVEWRRTEAGWEGRVAYAAQVRPGRWALVEEWLPADVLTR